MKKTILISLILFTITFIFAAEQIERFNGNIIPQNHQSRTEVIAYQETFETGAVDWTFSSTGNLWHLEEVLDAPSPVYAMINQNEQGSYNPSMNNFLYSPQISLPLSGTIKADFMMKGDFDDTSAPTSASVLDYWYWDISVFNGTSWSAWYRMNNPYNTAGVNPIVYIDAPSEWTYVTEGYSALNGLITNYAGQTVKFRICFHSDNDTPIGTGIMIDNFTIFNDVYLPAPTSLSGLIANQNVELNWDAPIAGFTLETITSTNSVWSSYVGDAEMFAMKITNPLATPIQLNGIKFILYAQNNAAIEGNPNVYVFENSDGVPGTQLAVVNNITNVPNNEWKFVNITSQNVIIPANGSVFVGINSVDGDGLTTQGLLCDATSVNANSYVLLDDEWGILSSAYTGLANCGLAGVYFVDDPFAPVVTGYKVYHSLTYDGEYTNIATINNAILTTYTHEDPVAGSINYYKVTAMFDQYESEPTNIFTIDLIGLLYTEISVDDGASNQEFNVGPTRSFATKFITDADATIHYVKVYLSSVGSTAVSVSIFNANGVDGTPGSQSVSQFTVPIAQLTQGWNSILVPASSVYTDADGVFYIAIRESPGSSVYALDTDSSGRSWKKMSTTGVWEPIIEGNVMIRALVNFGQSNEEEVEIAPVSNLKNYPNPFNSLTNISFDVRKAGTADLKVYNAKGQVIRTLSSGRIAKGTNNFSWDGRDDKGKIVSHGIYFCKLQTNGTTLTKKIVRIR